MKKMMLILCFGIMSIAFPALAQEPMSAEKEADIRTLMDQMGSADMAGEMMQQMKQMEAQFPEGFLELFLEKADPKDLIELIIPIYHKHFNHDEIKGLIEFYKTPLGKKLTESLSQITQDSMIAGQQWGQKIAMETMQELQSRSAAEPAPAAPQPDPKAGDQ